MHVRTLSATASLALLSTAASSPPLAFTAVENNRGACPAPFARRRAFARTLLRAAPGPTDQQSEFTSGLPPSLTSRTMPSTPTTAKEGSGVGGISSSSTLSMIVDSQKEFELNLGKAVDALKANYPKILTEDPSWDIYHADLEVVDPSGVSLHGLENYKVAFGFIHSVVKWFSSEEKTSMTSVRVGYDWARKCIRVSWNVEFVPKMIYGGTGNTLHVDGISEYYLDRESGLITEHRVSNLLINDQAVRPANGIWASLAEMNADPEKGGVPVFFGAGDEKRQRELWDDMTTVRFRTWNPLTRGQTSLFSTSEGAMNLPDPAIGAESPVLYDEDAFQRKNASRKRFGMPPMTPEEFIAIEKEVRAMDALNKEKEAHLAEKIAQTKLEREQKKKEGLFLQNIFGGVLKNGCESNFDCERPQVCCDMGFKKICCSNGLGIVDGRPVESYQRGVLRVPLPNDNIDY